MRTLPVVFEWFAREGAHVLAWWLLVTLAGAAVLPLCVRLLGGLPDRGYTLARAVGLLLVGYLFWLLGSLGFLKNTGGAILLAWGLAIGLSLTVYFSARERFDWRGWWRENRPVVVWGEVLFLVLLVGWAIVRAHQPELRTTEKPMDLMFTSSIMNSPTFPPNDGWMAGYSISYYYFGYFLAAMLSTASGVTSTVGYNLMNALVFALAGLTAFGVAYNLARARQRLTVPLPRPRAALFTGVLAAVMVILMGNFQMPLIEWPYQARVASESYLSFTATQDRTVYPERENARTAGIPDDQPVTLSPGQPDPTQWGYWWWFRASRVLNDFNLDGTVAGGAQPIDEFPQFSFLLSDNHPHVMALPFVLLALGLALNLLLAGHAPRRGETLLYGLAIGGLVFLNTWDGPIYLLALVGAELLRRLFNSGGRLRLEDVLSAVMFGALLGVLTALLYLPFLISFRSQASGLLPNLMTPTLLQHYFIMFGPFTLICAFFLVAEARTAGKQMNWRAGLYTAGGVLAALLAVLLLLMLVALFVPELYGVVLRFVDGYGGLGGALPLLLARRLQTLPTTLLLLVALVVAAARVFARPADEAEDAPVDYGLKAPTGFTLLLIVLAAGLSLVPEFFYLRDNFGTRINTIFKFYLQAWVIFSIASAYGVFALVGETRWRVGAVYKAAFAAVALLSVGMGMLYPIFGIHNRMLIESGIATAIDPAPLSLDGGRTMIVASDYSAITCWQQVVRDEQQVVAAEALGGAYNPAFGRVAGLTGVPVVLGWDNHERQWRGSTYDAVAGTRGQDIPTLYGDLRWDAAQSIIDRYGIDYVFYGSSERQAYGSIGEDKFRENAQAVCPVTDSAGDVVSVFYRVHPSIDPAG
jgi:YYY domain-containing protein